MFKYVTGGILIGLVGLCGCSSPHPIAATPPCTTLTIAVNDIYCHDTACPCVYDVAARTYSKTLKKLKEQYRIDLQLVYFTETYQLEDAIASGKYDGALCKPWFALRHEKEAHANFKRIVDVLDPNNNRWLTGIFIVPTNSPFQSLEELHDAHLYIGQADAYEKHQAALSLLKKRGVQPKKINTNASCSENIGVLLDGKADAAVISDYSLHADCAIDFASENEFRILAQTEKIPLTSLLLDLNKVSPETAERLQKALLALSGKDAAETLLGNGFVLPEPWNPPELKEMP